VKIKVIGMLIAILTLSALVIGLSAETVSRAVYRQSYVRGSDQIESDMSILIPDPDFSSEWFVEGEGVRVIRQEMDEYFTLRLSVRNTFSEDEIVLVNENPTSILGRNLMYIPLSVEMGSLETNIAMNVRVGIHSAEGEYYSSAVIDTDSWQEIVVDVSLIERIDRVTISLDCGEETPKTVRFSPVYYASGNNFDHISRYLTPSYEMTNAMAAYENGILTIRTTGADADVEGNFAFSETLPTGTEAFLLVTLSGEIVEGNMTCAFRKDGTYADSSPISLQGGRYVYSFPFSSGESDGYRLSFRNVMTSRDGGITVESVSVLWTGYNLPKTTANGYVSSIAMNSANGRLTVSGSVSQDVVTAHRNDELVLYAVPYTHESVTDPTLWGGVELMRSGIFMDFELVLDAALTAKYIGTHMFYVSIEGEVEEKLLLSAPRGVDHSPFVPEDASIVGISGVSAVGGFESNAAHVIVDLPFDRLILSDDGDRASTEVQIATTDGSIVRLNGSLLSELQAEVGFYNSANMKVYLRITNGEGSFAEGAASLDARGAMVYSTVLGHLFSSFSENGGESPAGVILGECTAYTREDFEARSMYYCTMRLAELMRITYSTMYLYTNGAPGCVILPVETGGEYNGVVGQMLAIHMSRRGAMPWYLMYSFNHDAKDEDGKYSTVLREAKYLLDTAQAFGGEGGALGLMYCFEPSEGTRASAVTPEYNKLCEAAEVYSPRVFFLEPGNLEDDQKEQLCRLLKSIRKEEKNSIIESFGAEYIDPVEKVEGGFTAWDFSGLYHTDGWIAGGSVDGCDTERSEIFSVFEGYSARALRLDIFPDHEDGMASGIVLRNFKTAVDLSGVDDLIFRFSVADTTENSTVIFIVGNEQGRGEYTVNDAVPGVVYAVRCPLSEYSGRGNAAYLGVMVYSADSAVLEIESVELLSSTLTPEEIEGLFIARDDDIELERANGGFYIAAVIGIITVFIVALMIRRDREEAEARGAVVPTRGRHRWNDTEGGR